MSTSTRKLPLPLYERLGHWLANISTRTALLDLHYVDRLASERLLCSFRLRAFPTAYLADDVVTIAEAIARTKSTGRHLFSVRVDAKRHSFALDPRGEAA